MSITPDTRDWTFVLSGPCPECGFDTRVVTSDALPALTRTVAAAWHAVLTAAEVTTLTSRTRPDRWSTLEYGCHVRDVCRRIDGRVALLLEEDDPVFPNWDQDATAIDDRYATQDPVLVAEELVTAADELASRFAAITGAAWQRPGRRSDGAHFTVATLGRYFLHDPVHHLFDVGAPRPPGL